MSSFTLVSNFNSHSHEESDVLMLLIILLRIDFNSHSHEESDRLFLIVLMFLRNFNSHSHEESDLVLPLVLVFRTNFNSHSHEESDKEAELYKRGNLYFNSHSHEESDCIILLAFERIIPYINFSRLNFFYCTYSIKLKKRLNEVRTSYINYNSLYFALIYQNCLALMILVGFSQY